ncbi:phospholipase D-like domain-containing protein [Salinibacillus xinjiangensis]|uniref:Cardiolipin synthetase n=1 Tax=Salinibacillus xinjiangensis TaxID=1229268 RepID=A0A6G1X5M0_9BACI|nr:phospholipase D-like domain-containing protein [Salinibacillus xinjiangensis]MRG86237.1 cardiolipin synthetase [Salinibacillus xinjiangensis]
MTWIAAIGIILICLIFLTWLDFYFGKKHHVKHREKLYFPISNGHYTLYQSGSPLFHDMFQNMKDAKKEINVQFFIVKRDDISEQLLKMLEEKTREGLKVRLLVDRVGGFRLTKDIRYRLREAGVEFAFSSRPGFPFFLYRLNRRNHRKIAVIDGETVYVGGFNIGKEYIDGNVKFSKWRDYHVRLHGPVAHDFQQVFSLDWRESAKPIEVYKPQLRRENGEVQVLATDGVGLENSFLQLFSFAKEEIMIGSPYFVPSRALVHGLKSAINRGVSVKIMVPMRADHPLVKEGAIPYLFEMKRVGADVRLYDQGFFHGKVLIIDQKVCDIGTANFDRRSFFVNKEINVIMYDHTFIEIAREQFMRDFNASIVLSEKWYQQLSWWTRIIKIPLAKLFRPLL